MAKGMSFKVLLQLQAKEFQKGINSIKKQLEGFGRFVKSAFALGSVTMFGKQVVQVSKDFEDAMARVQAVSNATTEEFKKMQDEAKRLGSTTRYTASEAASALENLTRNGMTATQATKALSDVLAMAQANSIELSRSADIMTNTLNMFGLSVNSAQKASDVLSSTASHAATDINSLYDALVNAAPAANVLGFSLEETSAAIGALAQRGVKGSEAGTKLRIAFQKMADPKVIAKMKEQGIEIDENSMKVEGLYKTVEKLANAKLSLGQLGSIFDAKSAMAVQQLVASMDDLGYMLDVTANSAGETARMMKQSVGSVQNELDTLKSKYEGLLISIGSKTSGVVKSAIKLLQNLIGNFETVGGTIANIGSVVIPLLIRKIMVLGSTATTVLGSISAGIAGLKAAMGGWVTIIATLVTWLGTYLVGAWNAANKEMKDATKQMAQAKKESADMQRELAKLKDMIGDGSDRNSVNGAVAKAIQMFPEFADAIRDAATAAKGTENGWQRLKDLLQDIADLQDAVSTRDAKKAVANASIKKYGQELYNSGGWWRNNFRLKDAGQDFGGGMGGRMVSLDRTTPESVLREIRLALKNNGFDKDTQKEIFNGLAEELINSRKEDQDNRINQIVKYLDDFGVQIAPDSIKEILQDSNYDTWFSQASRITANKNQEEYEKADSTYVATVVEKAFDIFKKSEEANKKLLEDKEITQQQFSDKMYNAAEALRNTVIEAGDTTENTWKKINDATAKYAKPNPNPGGGGGGGGGSVSKAKTSTDLVKDAIDDYRESTEKLQNRLDAGTISTEDYEKELNRLVDKTWETITAISNFEDILDSLKETAFGADMRSKYNTNRSNAAGEELIGVYGNLAKYLVPAKTQRDTKSDWKKTGSQIMEEQVKIDFDYAESLKNMVNDLETAIESGDFDLIKGDAIEMLEKLREAAKKASDEADNLQTKLDLSEAITKLDDEIKSLSNTSFNTFNTVADVFDRLSSSLMSIAQVFDEDLQDSPFFKAFQAFNSVLNSSIQIMEAVMSVIELRKQLETKAAMEKVKNTAVEVAANQAATASEMEKAAAAAGAAAAGGAASVASIPYIGPALAVAAVASITAAILAAMSKFANGGIVGGNSYSGDKNVVRVNSGEMILNSAQQKNLWDLANGGGVGKGREVTFKIRGADLVGAIDNYNSRRRG